MKINMLHIYGNAEEILQQSWQLFFADPDRAVLRIEYKANPLRFEGPPNGIPVVCNRLAPAIFEVF
jgi:hypothetical protein